MMEAWQERARRSLHAAEAKATLWLRHHVTALALWQMHAEARQELEKVLTEKANPEKLSRILEPHLQKALALRGANLGHVSRGASENLRARGTFLHQLSHELHESILFCQALRHPDPAICQGILRPEARRSCALDSGRLGILYAGRCNKKDLQLIAKHEDLPLTYLLEFCRVLRDGPAAACTGLRLEELEALQRCRAIAGDDEGPCRDPRLEEEGRRFCLEELRKARMARLTRHGHQAHPPSAGLFDVAFWTLSRPSFTCPEVVLRQFDQAAAEWFMLQKRAGCWWPNP
ncbi:MAG: hypothetical protein JRF33_27725 [Deltaproteobacteria bacterium]|nr:hypothetical protein [Deltaproteobacteria bacterium]